MNIFALKELVKHHRVPYDLRKEDALVVHLSNKILKFHANEQGLYVYKFPSISGQSRKEQQHEDRSAILQSVEKKLKDIPRERSAEPIELENFIIWLEHQLLTILKW